MITGHRKPRILRDYFARWKPVLLIQSANNAKDAEKNTKASTTEAQRTQSFTLLTTPNSAVNNIKFFSVPSVPLW